MKRLLPLISAALLFAGSPLVAPAQEPDDGSRHLNLRVKRALETSLISPPARAPFLPQPGEPTLEFSLKPAEDPRLKESRSSCARSDNNLCYDPGSNRIVIKKTREYMPQLPGLKRESVSLRRDRLTLKYSF